MLVTRARRRCPAGFEVFQRRIEGVLVARSYVMMDYDIERARVDDAVALTPGIEGPTVAPLHREGWVAVRAMVPARRRPAADGRALRHRRPRHPAHRHPCLPALSPRRRSRCRTPGGRSASRVAGAVARRRPARGRARSAGSASTTRPGPSSPASSAAPLIFFGLIAFTLLFALVRSRVVAEADRLVVVNGYRRHEYEWAADRRRPPAAGRARG